MTDAHASDKTTVKINAVKAIPLTSHFAITCLSNHLFIIPAPVAHNEKACSLAAKDTIIPMQISIIESLHYNKFTR